jgi:hypothetical protein
MAEFIGRVIVLDGLDGIRFDRQFIAQMGLPIVFAANIGQRYNHRNAKKNEQDKSTALKAAHDE